MSDSSTVEIRSLEKALTDLRAKYENGARFDYLARMIKQLEAEIAKRSPVGECEG